MLKFCKHFQKTRVNKILTLMKCTLAEAGDRKVKKEDKKMFFK